MDDDEFDDSEQLRCVSPDSSSDDGSNNTPLRGHHSNDNLDSYLEMLRTMDEQTQIQHVSASSLSTTTTLIPSSTGNVMVNDGIMSRPTASSNDSISILHPRGGYYEPYLYTIPFVIPEPDSTSLTSSSQQSIQMSQSVSCRIVFNLGLIHQTICRTSSKVASFYEIAATLLSSLPSTMSDDNNDVATMILLRIAILNNFGVWCYENGEGESMMNSFEQLVDTIQDDNDILTESSSMIDPSIIHGVRANIQAFLTPHNNVSLAA
jgi:hypothetical protein